MSNFKGNLHKGPRVSAHQVQRWILLPTGEITEWSADGFSLGGNPESTYDEIFIVDEIRMFFEAEPKIEVFVQDERHQPLVGVKVDHGWPAHKWPEFDESVMRVTDDEGKVEWALFAEFDPLNDIGPTWVALHGYLMSDVVMGMGIPKTFHYNAKITYQIVFRRVLLKHEALP